MPRETKDMTTENKTQLQFSFEEFLGVSKDFQQHASNLYKILTNGKKEFLEFLETYENENFNKNLFLEFIEDLKTLKNNPFKNIQFSKKQTSETLDNFIQKLLKVMTNKSFIKQFTSLAHYCIFFQDLDKFITSFKITKENETNNFLTKLIQTKSRTPKNSKKIYFFNPYNGKQIQKNRIAYLTDYLITPVQRLPRFGLMFKEAAKICEKSKSPYTEIFKSFERRCKRITNYTNKMTKMHEQTKTLGKKNSLIISQEAMNKNVENLMFQSILPNTKPQHLGTKQKLSHEKRYEKLSTSELQLCIIAVNLSKHLIDLNKNEIQKNIKTIKQLFSNLKDEHHKELLLDQLVGSINNEIKDFHEQYKKVVEQAIGKNFNFLLKEINYQLSLEMQKNKKLKMPFLNTNSKLTELKHFEFLINQYLIKRLNRSSKATQKAHQQYLKFWKSFNASQQHPVKSNNTLRKQRKMSNN